MRLGVYTDYVYREIDGVVYAERAFALFLAPLTDQLERLVLIGRSSSETSTHGYPLGRDVSLAPLQHYRSLARPGPALWSLIRSLRQMWRALDGIDVLWALGPYPHAILLVLLARVRRRTVVLGVRQDWPRYVRMRRPGRRILHHVADLMEWSWRRLARHRRVVAIGGELAANYAHAPAVLDLCVSLVPSAAVVESPPERDYDSELTILSVGRLESEKNPLLLADVLALLGDLPPGFRIQVVGQGHLADDLSARARQLGVSDRLQLLGYVAMGEPLMRLYHQADLFLHVSWTEGFPQVLIEAFAAGLPVVATDVGGVAAGAGDGALLVRPGDAPAAAEALVRLAGDAELRRRLVSAAIRRAGELTQEIQTARLLDFLRAAEPTRSIG